jgi:hypothetical protein
MYLGYGLHSISRAYTSQALDWQGSCLSVAKVTCPANTQSTKCWGDLYDTKYETVTSQLSNITG